MPILAIEAISMPGGTPILAGLAVGGYALTQTILQYPFGALSDRVGRKAMIAVGMSIFAIGSIICAFADSAWALIIGRFVQGAGAVSAVITATIGDLTPEEKRSKAMALMGMSIAVSFIVAFVAGPIAGGYYGIKALFLTSAILVAPALLILFFLVPTPPKITPLDPIEGSRLKRVFADKNLAKLNFAMFLHSFIMTGSYYLIPVVLTRRYDFAREELWKVYIPALLCGILAMGLGAMFGEKKNAVKSVMIFGITLLIGVFAAIALIPLKTAFIAAVIWLFVGINSLEPLMQSSATKFARADLRGSALGIFNAFQFAGVFFGGLTIGHFYGFFGLDAAALLLLVCAVLWLMITLRLDNPRRTAVFAPEFAVKSAAEIEAIAGVIECYRKEKLYIRYDPLIVSEKDVIIACKQLISREKQPVNPAGGCEKLKRSR
jgi:MFS family permease